MERLPKISGNKKAECCQLGTHAYSRLPHVATSLPDVSVKVFKKCLDSLFLFPLLLSGGTLGRGKNVIEMYCAKFLKQ